MEESQSAGKSRRTQRDSSLTKREMEAALQLVQLSSDSRDLDRTGGGDDYTAVDRKVKEEGSEGDSTTNADVSSSPFLIEKEKILYRQDKSLGQRKREFRISIGDIQHRITKALCDKHGKSRRTQNEGKTAQPEAKAAAQQLILLCDNSSESHKNVKEESNSNTSSIITNVSSAMETQLEINAAQQMLQLRENSDNYHTDEEGKGGQDEEEITSDLSSAIKRGFCQGKRRFRSVVEIYRTTKSLNVAVNAKKVRCF